MSDETNQAMLLKDMESEAVPHRRCLMTFGHIFVPKRTEGKTDPTFVDIYNKYVRQHSSNNERKVAIIDLFNWSHVKAERHELLLSSISKQFRGIFAQLVDSELGVDIPPSTAAASVHCSCCHVIV